MKPIIRVENLSKQYRIGASRLPYQTLRESVTNAVRKPLSWFNGNGKSEENTIWALKDVSFDVMPGEVVGVIGRNGAGKSTLLKLLSRITEPTTGRIDLYGRVGSLLEVGTGFHAELTGRENIYLNGAILGMQRIEIAWKLDEIIAFAEIEKFIDTPVKHYSSGMYMRLAFAVAAHLEPEILVIDEVLAVGDVQFQKKCLGKMGEVARTGRTVLFVSHNMAAVQSLCSQALLLNQGRALETGTVMDVTTRYLTEASPALVEQTWDDASVAPGNERVRLRRARIALDHNKTSDQIDVRTPFAMEFEFWNLKPDAHLNLSLHIYNEQGAIVCNPISINEPTWHGRPFPEGLFRSSCYVPGDLLNDGMYRVELLIVQDEGILLYHYNDVLVFEVHDSAELRSGWHGRWIGTVRPNLRWATEFVGQHQPANKNEEQISHLGSSRACASGSGHHSLAGRV